MNEVDVTRSTVIKDGNAFGVYRPDGELPAGEHSLGVFVDDCRHLCRHELRINGVAPRLLVSSDQAGSAAVYELTNPDIPLRDGGVLPLQALRVRVEQRIRPDGLDEVIELHSHHHEPVELDIALRLDADFAPMLELRRMLERVDRPVARSGAGATLRLSAVGLDGWTRATTISCEGAEATDEGLLAPAQIAPRSAHRLALTFGFSATPPSAEPPAAPALNRHPAAREAVADAHAWLADRARLETGDDLVDRIVRRSMLDLRLLISDLDGHPYVAAGVPWYATLFGRDSLICAHQMLAFDPALAAGTLRLLARHQGRRVDDRHDEQPGKILHELRLGEVANLDRSPLARYYGTVDATPLFLSLLCRYVDWTGSLSLFTELRPHVDAALEWMRRHGDLDGDGLIEYARRAPGGLDNQGWKDSWDGICDEHGRLLAGPIALIEAQAYAVRAWLDVALMLDRLGEDARAAELRARAEQVLVRMEDFWLPDREAYAMALDGDKTPSRALASNQGHLLWSEVVDLDRAQAIRDRLTGDALSSGWGIRTLGADEVAFNPVGYHTGTVWPHDTALIAAGLRAYGFDEDFTGLCEGLLDAAAAFPEFRLPELFAGFSRQEYEAPVPYPVACRPQAWSAGAVPYLLVTALGVRPDGLNRVLRIRRPLLPRMLDSVWLRGLRVAGAMVDLRFERVRGGHPAAAVTEARVDGDVDVVVDMTSQAPSTALAASAGRGSARAPETNGPSPTPAPAARP